MSTHQRGKLLLPLRPCFELVKHRRQARQKQHLARIVLRLVVVKMQGTTEGNRALQLARTDDLCNA
ncbi:hypothetical protein [Pseudomonas poae]|uniref:hypothetical protein n=1 Tax=Pseudomonas poae TaxID=200451 RepID=UPI0030E2B6EE